VIGDLNEGAQRNLSLTTRIGGRLRARERRGTGKQIPSFDGYPEMSRADEARVLAPVAWDEIGKGSPIAGDPERELSAVQSSVADVFGCRFIRLSPGKLHLHPNLKRYGIASATAQLNKILQQDESAPQEPVDVTRDGAILDGYPQWKTALDTGCDQILCIEHSLTGEQELEWLLRRHKRRNGWNPFCRIMTALQLEPKLKREAQANQIVGGQHKGLSNLTKAAQKHVRSKLAKLADTCEAYIDYAKKLRNEADDCILQALERGEITIHRAWVLLQCSRSEQRDILENRRVEKAVRQAYPRPRKLQTFSIEPAQMLQVWPLLVADKAGKIKCSVIPIGGKRVEFRVQIDEAQFARMQSQGELKLS
jgi:hypothetical protein